MSLRFCNTYSSQLWVTVMWYHSGCAQGGDWEKAGWWHLVPGECKTVLGFDLAPLNRYYCFEAEAGDGAFWSGEFARSVTDSAFDSCEWTSDATARVIGYRLLDIGTNTHFTVNLYGCPRPHYDPASWNDDNKIQRNNNCYNYACDRKTGTFAQPGAGSGHPIAVLYGCETIRTGARSDGLTDVPCEDECPPCCHKVALAVTPPEEDYPHDVDYHWYRLDDNGGWSHKPGNGTARDYDNSGRPITDPRTADRGPYTEFCGCFCVCPDHLTIG